MLYRSIKSRDTLQVHVSRVHLTCVLWTGLIQSCSSESVLALFDRRSWQYGFVALAALTSVSSPTLPGTYIFEPRACRDGWQREVLDRNSPMINGYKGANRKGRSI